MCGFSSVVVLREGPHLWIGAMRASAGSFFCPLRAMTRTSHSAAVDGPQFGRSYGKTFPAMASRLPFLRSLLLTFCLASFANAGTVVDVTSFGAVPNSG